jgi:hypothetical protein
MFPSPRTGGWILALCLLLLGCAPAEPFRRNLYAGDAPACPLERAEADPRCATATPEVDPGKYELHFVEFDDQGWLYPEPRGAAPRPDGGSWDQADHLVKRLSRLLEQGEYLNLIVYVHGWKHNADVGDDNLRKFRGLLKSTAVLEQMSSPQGSAHPPRKVVGIYIGWRGKAWNIPDWALNLSFWSRKTAAQHVALGAVQDLFARLRAIQSRYTTSNGRGACLVTGDKADVEARCRIRSLIVGHSFGAAIVYAAVAPQLIESLSVAYDRRDERNPAEKTMDGIEPVADMVVLLNPAFEASRFEPLRRAADRYRPRLRRPPVMVVITSENDWATKYTFPLGRFFNTLAERPVTSDEQGKAIRTTPGHMDDYLTHTLTMGTNPCPNWTVAALAKSATALKHAETVEADNARGFYANNTSADGTLKPAWTRVFCGGATLQPMRLDTGLALQTEAARPTPNPNPLVWNVKASRELVDGHGGITLPGFTDFVRQLYDDVGLPAAYGPAVSQAATSATVASQRAR